MKNLAFDYFEKSWYIECLKWLFYITLPAGVLIFIISNCYEIENIPSYSNLLKTEEGNTCKKKLLLSRMGISFFILFWVFFLNNEYYLTVISGCVLVPFVGFIFPVF